MQVCHLSTLRYLTSLCTSCVCYRKDCVGGSLGAMEPVGEALGSLQELRHLELWRWLCESDPLVDTCWRSLGLGLPMLRHLTSLTMGDLCLSQGFSVAHFQTLARALPCLPVLCSLVITGASDGHDEPDWNHRDSDIDAAASEQLARSCSALPALTRLALSHLEFALRARDCYLHMSKLTQLRDLELRFDPSSMALEDQPAGSVVDEQTTAGGMMAGGMTQLTRLLLHMQEPSVPTAAQLLCQAILCLPRLAVLETSRCLHEASAMTLAEHMCAGSLLAL